MWGSKSSRRIFDKIRNNPYGNVINALYEVVVKDVQGV